MLLAGSGLRTTSQVFRDVSEEKLGPEVYARIAEALGRVTAKKLRHKKETLGGPEEEEADAVTEWEDVLDCQIRLPALDLAAQDELGGAVHGAPVPPKEDAPKRPRASIFAGILPALPGKDKRQSTHAPQPTPF